MLLCVGREGSPSEPKTRSFSHRNGETLRCSFSTQSIIIVLATEERESEFLRFFRESLDSLRTFHVLLESTITSEKKKKILSFFEIIKTEEVSSSSDLHCLSRLNRVGWRWRHAEHFSLEFYSVWFFPLERFKNFSHYNFSPSALEFLSPLNKFSNYNFPHQQNFPSTFDRRKWNSWIRGKTFPFSIHRSD